MLAKTPIADRKMAALNPNLVRETVRKVDKAMARLQELQNAVSGGTKVMGAVSLSPRSTRGYIRTSLRCKQESLRIKNGTALKSPAKIKGNSCREWRRMSLPAMLVGETVGEILQASRFAKEVVAAVTEINKPVKDDPKTPVTGQKQKPKNLISDNRELLIRRKREKQGGLARSETTGGSPTIPSARSRINFKVSAANERGFGRENQLLAHRISPRHRPWAKKAVLFPNPLFLSSPSSQQPKFVCKTRSPLIARTRPLHAAPPHKFLVKSPPSSSKFSVKIKSPPISLANSAISSRSPTGILSKKHSPPRSIKTSKLRCSFSPSKLANRLVSPLKSRILNQKSIIRPISGLKQRPPSSLGFAGSKV